LLEVISNGGKWGAIVKRIVEKKSIVIRKGIPVEIILYSVYFS